MCEKCAENDRQIARITRLQQRVNDDVTLERFAALIKEYEAEKRKLHPEPEQ